MHTVSSQCVESILWKSEVVWSRGLFRTEISWPSTSAPPLPHSLWYAGSVQRADWIYINFFACLFLLWDLISSNASVLLDFWGLITTLQSFTLDVVWWRLLDERETKKRWLIDLDIYFALRLLFEVLYTWDWYAYEPSKISQCRFI